jgi:formylmethanofuran dehydrogenase subunit B
MQAPAKKPASDVQIQKKDEWTCPFCPLLCDDIKLETNLTAPHASCPKLTTSLARAQPSIDTQPTDVTSALSDAAKILSQAKRPLFSGLATDISGARALYELAALHGATLDHLHGDALAANTRSMQDRGAFFTTLSEVRSRADLMIVFACTPSRNYPRFYERVLDTKRQVDVVFVGCEADIACNQPSESILQDADAFDTLAHWSAHIEAGREIASPELIALSERIIKARYTVFVYEPASLPAPHAALAIEALHRIVKAINRTVRAGALALTGDDGALTVNQTVTWLSGFPLRTRVAYGVPLDHDMHRYSTHALLHQKQADALLWVSSFAPEALPASLDEDVPAIVLGHPRTQLDARNAPTVFIPVATPGLDHASHLFRVDTSVVAPLSAARDNTLPSVASIVNELIQRGRTS